ncbi:MAG TPA: hypothetical protein VKB91_03360 [Gemmatimonadaceae bacterium]|nr:hypothetical protein [Gemmatimonadaceae bacterium]
MDDTPEVSEALEVSDAPELTHDPPAPRPASKWRRNVLVLVLTILLIPIVVFSLWAWVTLGYVYSSGDRAGYVQKLSKKGWICKTWEGELNMVSPPGTVTPQIFNFTVRSDSLAEILERDIGKRVSLTYQEHRGIPSSCFGETEYFVSNVRILTP